MIPTAGRARRGSTTRPGPRAVRWLAALAAAPTGPDAEPPANAAPSPTTAPSASPSATATPAPSPSTATPTPARTSPSPKPAEATPTAAAVPRWATDTKPPWQPTPGEVAVDAKRRAAEVVTALTTYDRGDRLRARLRAVAGGDTTADRLAGARELHHPGAWSRGTILYPQMGGFAIGADPTTGIVPETGPISDVQTASVMVVVEQRWGDGAEPVVETRTVDVRLERDAADEPWRLAAVPSGGGTPVAAAGDLHPALTDDRIVLPDSSRWDVAAGRIDPLLLDLLVDVAERFPIEVVVLESGHPINVFATDRVSSHTVGRAADINVVAGDLVVESHATDSATRALVEQLYDDPRVSNIGSPWALDGFGGRSFTDLTHADHIHVAVRPLEDEAATASDGDGG